MAISAVQKRAAWRWVLTQDPSVGQVFAKPDLDAAVVAADSWLDTNKAATTSGPGYNAALPASPGFRAATTQQKALLLAAVALAQGGLV